MSVANVQFHSPAMGKSVTYNVILPETEEGPFPVLMQLHGLSDDANGWIQRSNLVRHAAKYPFLIVLPDGGTSGFLNWPVPDRLGKQNYEDLLIQDIPTHVERIFRVRSGPWAIGGLSMGGYGAMRLGLKYPERFASIWSHSSAFHIGEMAPSHIHPDRDDLSVFWHASRLAECDRKPVISFDCGTEDELVEHNRRFHQHMTSLGLIHHYAEHTGGHTWEYWDVHIQVALAQHARVLGEG